MITDKFKTDVFTDIANNALKPMSIMAIKEKFNLSFPFQVKRVIDCETLAFSGVTTILFFEVVDAVNGKRYGTNNRLYRGDQQVVQGAEIEDYILYEQN